MAVLVYGIVRPGHPPRGLSHEQVRRVDVGPVAALVVPTDDDAVLDDDDVDAYLDTLIEALAHGPVLPVEFGTVAPDDDAVRAHLGVVADVFRRRLDDLEGLVEVRVDLTLDEVGAIRRIVANTPALERVARLGTLPSTLSDRVALGEQMSFALADLRDALGDQLLDRVGDLAVAHALRPSSSVTELRHAYLIRAEDLPEVDAVIDAFRAELDESFELEYVGPLPAFDFTEVELEAGPRSVQEGHRWGW